MKLDRVINTIPMTIGDNINGYWIVKNADRGTGCHKCAFYKDGEHDCPTLYMESVSYCHDTGEGPKPKRECPLCIAFGDTANVYFTEVEDDEITG